MEHITEVEVIPPHIHRHKPILDEIKMYEVPYLKDEVNSLIMWLKDNK